MENKKEKIYLFHQGTYTHAYELMGCHPFEDEKEHHQTARYYRRSIA